MPNSVFTKRQDIVLRYTEDSYRHWEKMIDAERGIIIEGYMGGTGAYYSANMYEIRELLKRLGDFH